MAGRQLFPSWDPDIPEVTGELAEGLPVLLLQQGSWQLSRGVLLPRLLVGEQGASLLLISVEQRPMGEVTGTWLEFRGEEELQTSEQPLLDMTAIERQPGLS